MRTYSLSEWFLAVDFRCIDDKEYSNSIIYQGVIYDHLWGRKQAVISELQKVLY